MIENIRRLCRDLAPSALEDLGLTAALYWQIENMARLDDFDIDPRIDPIDELFTQAQQILIYRIFQETLANIVKHARADTVMVAVTKEIDAVIFVVEDNGIGFDTQAVNTREFAAKGLGLAAMSVRARMLGAKITIDSFPGQGTRIEVAMPVTDQHVNRIDT